MARVVARRGSSQSRGQLILLVTFAFLFVVVAALAAMSYSQMDKAEKTSGLTQAEMERQEQTLDTAKRELRDLAALVTGSDQGAYAEVASLGESAYQDVNVKAAIPDSRGGLTVDLMKAAKLLSKEKEKVAALRKELEKAAEAMGQKVVSTEELVATHNKAMTAAGKTMGGLKVDVNEKDEAVLAAIARGAANLKTQREELEKQIQAREQRILGLSGKTEELTKIIGKLKVIIDELQGEKDEARPDLEPDGHIVKVAGDDLVCYINIGSEKGVKPGMTFAISPKGQNIEVQRDANGDESVVNVKGFIRVISPKKGFSECLISKDDPKSPLAPGDNITNAAFRAARNYNFVVKGLFDLHGLGHATRSGRREVEQIITKFGGKVVPEIDFMTDYVVVGVEPKTPPQPASDATDSVRAAYKRQKKQYDDYQAIFTEAKKIGIPVLSQNRFLIFTGYMPEKEEE